MTTTTQINITAKDSTAGAFASANNNLTSLASSALKTTAGLAGIGISIAGAVDAIKGISQATIQFQQFTSTLQVGTGSAKGAADALSFVRSESQRLGLDLVTSAEQFGKLTAASRGTTLEGKATRDIFSAVAQAATAMGLSADQTSGSLLAIQQIISKGTVSAEELRGQLGERLPGAFQIAARAMGVTTAELDKLLRAGSITAEQMLPALSAELNKTFGGQAEQAAQGLTAQMNRMNTAMFDLKVAIGESGLINFLSSGIELATKLANALTSAFGGQRLSPLEKQVSLIQTLEKELESLQNLSHVPLIGDLLFDKKQADLLKFRIETATEDLAKLKANLASESGGETIITKSSAQAEVLSATTKKTISDAERFIATLRKESDTIGLTAIEMKRLEAAQLGVSKTADPLIDHIERITAEMDEQKEAAQRLAVDMRKIESITESVKTKEEKLADTQAELNRLLGAGLPLETYTRAMAKAQRETEGLEKQTINTTDAVSQLWLQAGRNIQSTLADSIFNFFDDGLKGMVKNVGIAVARIASEFAALRIAQGIGLAGMFGVSGTASAGSSALDIASLTGNAASLFKGGFGALGALGGGISGIGSFVGSSTLSAFGGGLAGDAIGGLAAGGFSSGAASAASMGSAFGAVAGPAVALFAVDAIGRLLAGDKKLGGAEMIPVLGGFLAALFGRGPYKFRQQSLQGTASSEGFEGDITNVFRAKGGLFRSNGHKSQTEQFTLEQQTLFDNTLDGFYGSARNFAKNLGLSTELVDSFTLDVQIKSEKGKKLTEEAISEMLDGIGNSLARNVLPIVDTLRKAGEDSFATLTRLNAEFVALDQAAQNLGASSEYAKSLVSLLSFEQRTSLVDMAGGFEELASISNYFFSNFLSAGERLELKTAQLNTALADLGVSTSIAVEDYKKLIQAESTANDLRFSLLQLAPAFLEVRNAQVQLGLTTNTLADSERTLNSIRSELLGKYNQERGELESTISKFKGVSDKLRDFRQSLAFGELSPLTPAQKLEQARNNFNQVRSRAAAGDSTALDQLPTVAQEFLRASQTYNASSAAYLSDFDLVRNVLENAEKTALSQSEIARSQLESLQSSVEYLLSIDNATKTTNDLLKELIAATLTGSGNPAISTEDIKGFLAANPNLSASEVANAATKYGVSTAQLGAAGFDISLINKATEGGSVTDKDIKDFVAAHIDDPMAIYNAAVANGVSSSRLAKVSGIALTDIQKFVQDNNLPSFAKGTDFIRRSGLAMVHRAEAIVPSSTTDEIKKLREELAALRAEQNRQTGDMIKVTDITNRQNAQVIAKALADAEKSRQWSDRSKAALA